MTRPGVAARQAARYLTSDWNVRNFKALDYAVLPLVHLNVLVGANSSGKSSMIQSLLLLAQSTSDEIILNGPLVRLGNARDAITTGSSTMSFGFSAPARKSARDLTKDYLIELSLREIEGVLSVCEFSIVEPTTGSTVVHASSEHVTRDIRAKIEDVRSSHESILRVKIIADKTATAGTYLTFAGLIPETLTYNRRREKVVSAMKRGLRSAKSDARSDTGLDAIYELTRYLSAKGERPSRTAAREPDSTRGRVGIRDILALDQVSLDSIIKSYAEENVPETEWVRVPLFAFARRSATSNVFRQSFAGLQAAQEAAAEASGTARDAIASLQQSIRYLGPLREEPQVVSPTGSRYLALPAGSKGEFTADLLARSGDQNVRYADWNGERHEGTVAEALTAWVHYLGVGEAVSVEDQGKLGRGLRILVNGVARDLTTIGVGASQLVPVLMVVLSARPGSVILLEQPELHLHPSVQSRLADFFLRARSDVKIVVETHSEYFITRLRRRIVESPGLNLRTAVLFAEQYSGHSEIRRLHLDRLGDFSDWPKGFFDTQDDESQELVRAVQRALKRDDNQ